MTPRELKVIRERLGQTQRRFAETLGVHYVTVARWETGRRRIPETVARLATLLAPPSRKGGKRRTK